MKSDFRRKSVKSGSMYLAFYTREHSCVPQSGAQMCSQDVSERMLGTFRSTENVFSVEERSDIGGGGFVALLHEIGRKTCRKRDKQGGNRLGLFTRKKKDNAPENRPVPRHIAVIMDGNGRWAKKRGLPRNGRSQGRRGDVPHHRHLLQGHRRAVFHGLCILY